MKRRNRFANVEPIPSKDVPVLCPQYDSLGNIIYECIQAIEYPAPGSGGTYFYEYWNSLIEKLKTKPFPGSKELFQGGHESESADFYTTGMKIVGDEENGIVYFRISIPEVDMIGNKNDGLITALKAGSVEFSIVAEAECETINGREGFFQELGWPRNDLAGTGYMKQSVFANSAKEKEYLALISQGKIIECESNELIVSGNLNVTAVKNIRPTDNALRNRILKAIDIQKNKRIIHKENKMTPEEIAKLTTEITKNVMTGLEEKDKKKKEEENSKKNSLSESQQEMLRKIGEEFELPSDAAMEDILKVLIDAVKKSEEATAEVEANKFAGRKTFKNAEGKEEEDPIFSIAKSEHLALGHKIFNKAKREDVVKQLNSNVAIRTLRESNADAYSHFRSTNDPYAAV